MAVLILLQKTKQYNNKSFYSFVVFKNRSLCNLTFFKKAYEKTIQYHYCISVSLLYSSIWLQNRKKQTNNNKTKPKDAVK